MAQAVLEHELSEHSECSHGRSQVQSDGPSTVTPESSQMSKTTVQVSHYGEIDFTALRPIVPPPLDNTEIKYATLLRAVVMANGSITPDGSLVISDSSHLTITMVTHLRAPGHSLWRHHP
ncbi:hypothetical protein EMCRGX_G001675 [Ephydatia muelleri]